MLRQMAEYYRKMCIATFNIYLHIYIHIYIYRIGIELILNFFNFLVKYLLTSF